MTYVSGALFTYFVFIGCQSSQEHRQFAAFTEETSKRNKNTSSGMYEVTKVSDGDTFWCTDIQGNRIKIRLIGIDAPEPRNYFKKKEQPFGKEASKYAKNLLLHKKVRLEFDVDSLDQFGRTLAYAYLLDNTFVNEKIIKDGYAVLMTIAPNIKYEHRFIQAQKYARNNELGLWSIKE